ncbi:MAG: metallophosphoesterase [Hyphomicrobiales bacterium]|nr:metallophosphoesterase [Hyphomicrobiales bacterium]
MRFDKRPHSICFVGDTGKDNGGQQRVADALAADVECTLTVFVGDIIYPNGAKNGEVKKPCDSDSQWCKKFYDYYGSFCDGDPNRHCAYIEGNHDASSKDSVSEWSMADALYPNIHYPRQWYSIVMGDVCLFGLDSNVISNAEQITWFQKEKQKLNDRCAFSIVFTHHNYRVAGFKDTDPPVEEFHERYLNGVVDLVVSGHDHHNSVSDQIKGTYFTVAGAGAENRGTKIPVPSYNLFAWGKKCSSKCMSEDYLGYAKLTFDGQTGSNARLRFIVDQPSSRGNFTQQYERVLHGSGIR